MRVAIAITTKDKVELTKHSIEPLLHGPFDLFWLDGSETDEGKELPYKYGIPPEGFIFPNIRGGADPAIVASFTKLLDHPNNYDVVGLVESDVLLHRDFYGPMMALFQRGKYEGLEVGAVSARAYQDRILIQRDGYAVMHNLGAGMIVLTREAAQLTLKHCRTGYTTENRRLFAQLSGNDIGRYWAFRGGEHAITLDWHLDMVLAAHGLASLALTPSPVEMIGQNPPLAEQGLEIADGKFDLLRDDRAFGLYRDRLESIRAGVWRPTFSSIYQDDTGHLYFPHQVGSVGAKSEGDWRLKWTQGFGPFSWRANGDKPSVSALVAGPCDIIVSGGEKGGKILVEDDQSGYRCDPDLSPENERGVLQIAVPGNVAYRDVKLTALSPGVVFYGIHTRLEQPSLRCAPFDWQALPPV